jgi:hypothetical protein
MILLKHRAAIPDHDFTSVIVVIMIVLVIYAAFTYNKK